jgi:hypothetical protein
MDLDRDQSSQWIESICVSDEWAQTSGKYFVKGQPAQSSEESYDQEKAARLWDSSLKWYSNSRIKISRIFSAQGERSSS